MRQLNLRFLVILLGSIVVLGGGLFLMHKAQSGRIARAMLRQAERADQQGKHDQKIKYLSRYLEFVPNDNDVRAELARTLASPDIAATPRAQERALFVLEQVLLREPDRHDSRRQLVRMAFHLGRLELVDEHLRQLPADGETARQRGRLHAARGDFAKAAMEYRQAVQLAPHDVEGYVLLAEVLRRRIALNQTNDPALKEADQVMNDLVARNGDNSAAYLARWQYRREFHALRDAALEEAGNDVVRALELTPDKVDVIRAAADLALLRNDTNEARRQLKRGIGLHAPNGTLYQALAHVEIQARQRKDAIACLREGIRNVAPGAAQNDLLWTLGNLLVEEDDAAEAGAVIEQLRKARFSLAGADFLAARLAIKKGQWAEAARLLERAQPALESQGELGRQLDLLLAQCYERLDEPTGRRVAIYDRLVKRDPNSAANRQAIASSLFAMGRLEEALDHYRQMAALPDAPANAWANIARLLMVRNVQRGLRDWKEVEEALLKADPKAVETVVLRSQLWMVQDKKEQARQVLEQARQREPKQVEYWSALAALAEREGQSQEAERLLTEAREKAGDSVELRLAWARHWSSRRPEEARPALAALAEKTDSFPIEARARLLLGLVEARCRIKDFKEAEQLWGRLAQQPRYANDLRVQQLWFDLALQSGQEDSLRSVLESIRRLEEGEGPLWHYGEALRLIRLARQGKKDMLDEAKAHLDTALARRPAWPAVLTARAQVDDLKGNTEQAIANYRQAMELGERSPQATRELVKLLHRARRMPEADQEIRRLEQQAALPADLERIAADISLQNQDPTRAIRFALKAVPSDSNDYGDHLWLGQLLAARGQASEAAEQNLRRAVELGPEAPETWVALVSYLAAYGRAKEAEEVVKRAQDKLPAKLAPLALGQCFEALSQMEEAFKQYQKAVIAHASDVVVLRTASAFFLRIGRLAEAEPILRALMDRKVKADASDAAWARRQLAQGIANHADYRRYAEALTLVGLRLEDESRVIETTKPVESEAAEEHRARARILLTANRRVLRRPALGFLEQLAQRRQLTIDDQFLLAQMYEADGAWPRAREQFRNLTSQAAVDPLCLAHAARSYLRYRETEEARRCIERLEQAEKSRQVEPGQYGSVELRAQLLEATGKGFDAVKLLADHAQRFPSMDNQLLLASGLARQNRVGEALDACARAWTSAPPEVVGGASVSVLRSGQATPEHCARVERWLNDALKKNPAASTLLLHLADVRDLQERYSDAATIYRQILAKEPGNVVALNNLAWLLAQQPKGAAESLQLIDRAIQLVGPRAELLDTRALVHLSLGRSDLAIADLERSNTETPSGPRYFHLARAHLLANNADAATAAFRKARATGLAAEQLHPVERVAYRKMLNELK